MKYIATRKYIYMQKPSPSETHTTIVFSEHEVFKEVVLAKR
jgi:hypothetical protein